MQRTPQSFLGQQRNDFLGNIPEVKSAPMEKKMSKARVVLTPQMLRAIKNSPKGVIPRGLVRKVSRRNKLNKK